MGTFHILTDVIFVWSDIYQLKSIKMFSHIKTGIAPAWLDSENYNRIFHLATLSEKVIVS